MIKFIRRFRNEKKTGASLIWQSLYETVDVDKTNDEKSYYPQERSHKGLRDDTRPRSLLIFKVANGCYYS